MRRNICVLTVSMARDHRRAPGCRKHFHRTRAEVDLAVASGRMSWIDENTAAVNETGEEFLARYTRRAKQQPNLMDLEKVLNSEPVDRTARLVSKQAQRFR